MTERSASRLLPLSHATASGRAVARAAGARRFRRAMSLLLVTLAVPGLAQLIAGRRDLGRFTVRAYVGLLGATGLTTLWEMAYPESLLWFATHTAALELVRLGLVGLALAWTGLFVDALRLGTPHRLRWDHRLLVCALAVGLSLLVVAALLTASGAVASTQRSLALDVPDVTAAKSRDGTDVSSRSGLERAV